MKKPEIAIFGGSFDPPHIGHVLLAQYALSITDVVDLIVVPAYTHAFGKDLRPFEHRLAMAKLAFADLGRVSIDPIERELGGVSRTLRLAEQLALRHPGYGLRLLVGADILVESSKWQHFEGVRALAPLIVAGRGGFSHPDIDPLAPTLPEVSSSEIRAALARGDSVSTQVPARVRHYIAQHGLYRAEPAP